MNMMVIACGDTAILVDAGVMFPEPELLGVDLVIPDLRQLQQYRIAALVLTHGHEDHIGAVPHVLPYFRGPGLRHRADAGAASRASSTRHGEEARRDGWCGSSRASACTVGAFTIEFLRVTHSMPDCVALAIETPRGVVIHTGDFKIDQTPLDGEPVDFHRLARARVGGRPRAAGRQHEHRPARASPAPSSTSPTPSRRSSPAPTARSSSRCSRRASTGCRSSSIWRRSSIARVAFVGRGVIENSEIAQRLGYLRMPAGVQIRDTRRAQLRRRRTSSASARGRRASRRRRCRGSPSTITAT